ncbi:MAG: sugar ABC transporter substrate-binding protein [Bifidobacteriaceae bacterium]|jgi:multiple sugar transport system substrate-binding protein|nr:sugar ABC transporter substrate-binding protein [Bifidobacteriaceae bacterium]MCI1979197.1 sugar ABC transporter substrate-binding protein [Bifidobacteriaceae bacterium]
MKFIKKTVATLSGAALIFGLAACGSGSSNTSSTSASGDKTTLTVWAWEPYLKKAVPAFEKANPNIKIKLVNAGTNVEEYSALNNAIQAGSGAPDLVQLDFVAISQFALQDSLEPLDDLGATNDVTKFTDAVKQDISYNNKIYSMPLGLGPMAFFYNKEVFDKAGIANAPTTWDEFYQDAKKVRALGKDYYIANDSGDAGMITSMLWAAGAHPFKVDGQKVTIDFSSPEVKKYTTFWQKLIDEDLIDTQTVGWSDDWYKGIGSGHIASLAIGSWMTITLEDSIKDLSGKMRVAALPGWSKDDHRTSENGGGGLSIVKGSQNAEAAYKFAQFISVGEGSQIAVDAGMTPANKDILNSDEFLNKEYPYFGNQKINKIVSESVKNVGTDFQFLPYTAYANKIFADSAGKAYTDKTITVQDGLNEWQKQLVDYGNQQGFEVNK